MVSFAQSRAVLPACAFFLQICAFFVIVLSQFFSILFSEIKKAIDSWNSNREGEDS